MQQEWADAIEAGDADAVTRLLDAGHAIDARDRYGQTGLMLAAMRGHPAVVRLLIERGADLDVAAKFNLTALMLAIVNLHEDVAIVLIDGGADLEHRGSGAPGFAGLTALDLARPRQLEAVVAAIEERSRARR